MTIKQEVSIIEKIAVKQGYTIANVRDYFVEFCKDESCIYYVSGHLWVLTNDSDIYKDWSNDFYSITHGINL